MVNRLANFAHHQLLNSHMLKLQSKLYDAQIAVATEKKTQEYGKIPQQSERLVKLEHLAAQADNFIENNKAVDLRLETVDINLEGMEETIGNIYDLASDYSTGEKRDPEEVERVQKFAYQALQQIEGFLNESVAGRYLFSGSRTSQAPVDLQLGSSLAEFQNTWNGDTKKYPETQAAHQLEFGVSDTFTFTLGGSGNDQYMEVDLAGYAAADYGNFEVGADITFSGGTSNDGTWTVSEVDTTTGYLRVKRKDLTDEASADDFVIKRGSDEDILISDTMTYAGDTITAAGGAGTFSDVTVPSTLEIASGSGNNTMRVTITDVSSDGSSITVSETVGTAAAGEAGTLQVSNYYNGDQMEIQHRLDENRTIQANINALDPAFDKAIRGLAIIAQGQFGTAGGLDQNTDRIDEAIWLLDSAMDFPTDGSPPYGAESIASLEQLRFNTAFSRQQISSSIERETKTNGFMLNNVSDIEDVNLLEASTELLDIDRALQASYQVLARTQNLGLANFL